MGIRLAKEKDTINTIPKSYYSGTKVERCKALICGYIRKYKQLNRIHDHVFAFDIIFSFYYEGCANWITVKQARNKTEILNSKSGDIIEYPRIPATIWAGFNAVNYMHRQMYIVDPNYSEDNNEIFIDPMSQIYIPFSICSKLYNTVEFYSELINNPTIWINKEGRWRFDVKPDDGYIIDRFGGPFNPEYVKCVVLWFVRKTFHHFDVHFDEIGWKSFNFSEYKCDGFVYTYKDITNFYECRKTGKLIRIKVSYEWNKHVKYNTTNLYSAKWERCHGGSSGSKVNSAFIGPFNEKTEMINIIKQIHEPYNDNLQIEEIEMNDEDL